MRIVYWQKRRADLFCPGALRSNRIGAVDAASMLAYFIQGTRTSASFHGKLLIYPSPEAQPLLYLAQKASTLSSSIHSVLTSHLHWSAMQKTSSALRWKRRT